MKKVITIIMIFVFVLIFTLTASSYTYIQKPNGYFQLSSDVQDIVDEAMQDAYDQALEDVEDALSMKTYYELPWEIQNLIEEIEENAIEEIEYDFSMEHYYNLPYEMQNIIEDIKEDAYNQGYQDAKNNYSYVSTKAKSTLTSKQTLNNIIEKSEAKNTSTTKSSTTQSTTTQPTEIKKSNFVADYAPYILLAFVSIAFIVYIIVNKKKKK